METAYYPAITAVLCINLYNDCLREGGKLFPWVVDITRENNMHEKRPRRPSRATAALLAAA
jgi:hypothetical protein